MPWKEVTSKQLAKDLGIDYRELKAKHELIKKIIAYREKNRLSQATLAKIVGLSQARIAQIESRVYCDKVSFEVLFKLLASLGYEYKLTVKKVGTIAA